MKTTILIATALSVLTLSSCKKEKWPYCIKAKGDITEETRVLENFDEVDFNLSGNLHITYDPNISSPEITIKTSENIMDRIGTEVNGGKLKIKDKKCIRQLKSFDAYLTVKDLSEVSLNGSGDINSTNEISVDKLRLNINGSGNIDVDLKTDETILDINGSGDIKAKGVTTDLEISINGSGNVHAFPFIATNAYVNINGSGKAEVHATDLLDVDISGSGDVIYEGSPKVNVNSSGSGTVKAK